MNAVKKLLSCAPELDRRAYEPLLSKRGYHSHYDYKGSAIHYWSHEAIQARMVALQKETAEAEGEEQTKRLGAARASKEWPHRGSGCTSSSSSPG